jgi:hypothetical protein
MRDHALAVERNDLDARIGKFLGLEPGAIAKTVVAVRYGDLDLLNSDLQRIAGLGALDIDGAV